MSENAELCYFCQKPGFNLETIFKISEKKRVPICAECREDYEDR